MCIVQKKNKKPRTRIRIKDINKKGLLYTTLGNDDVNVTIECSYLYIPTLIASPETQVMCNESIMKTFTLSFEAWITDRKPVNQGKNFQHDFGTASNVSRPLYVKTAHQKTERVNPNPPAVNLSNNRCKKATLENVSVLKPFSGNRWNQISQGPII